MERSFQLNAPKCRSKPTKRGGLQTTANLLDLFVQS